jgi:thiamine-phosphate pyrophosphorylase
MSELQLLTSYEDANKERLYRVVEQAIDAGCKTVQFSWSECTDLSTFKHAERIREITSKSDVTMIVNNRLDIAMAVSADMLWLGQTDLPYQVARRMLHNDIKLGLSVHPKQIPSIDESMIDAFGIGPIFKTVTKTSFNDTVGLSGLALARSLTDKKIVAIGGIRVCNAQMVMNAGADEIAVIGEVYRSDDISHTISKLLEQINK